MLSLFEILIDWWAVFKLDNLTSKYNIESLLKYLQPLFYCYQRDISDSEIGSFATKQSTIFNILFKGISGRWNPIFTQCVIFIDYLSANHYFL